MRRRHALADRLSRMHHHIRKRNDTGNIFTELQPLADVVTPLLSDLVSPSATSSQSLPLTDSSKTTQSLIGQSSSTAGNVRQPLSTSASNIVFLTSETSYASLYDSQTDHASPTLEQSSALPTPVLRLPNTNGLTDLLDSAIASSSDTPSLSSSTVAATRSRLLTTQHNDEPSSSMTSAISSGGTRAALITTITPSSGQNSAASTNPIAAISPPLLPSPVNLGASTAALVAEVASQSPVVVSSIQLESIKNTAASLSMPQQFSVISVAVSSTQDSPPSTSSPIISYSQQLSQTVARNGLSNTEQASVLRGQVSPDQPSASSAVVLPPATVTPTTMPMLVPASQYIAAVTPSSQPSLVVNSVDRASGALFSTPTGAIVGSLPSTSATKPHLVQFSKPVTTLTKAPSTTYSAGNVASSLEDQSDVTTVARATVSSTESSKISTNSPGTTTQGIPHSAATDGTRIDSMFSNTATNSVSSYPAATASSPAVPASTSQSVTSSESEDAPVPTMSIPPIVITESDPSTASETGPSSSRQTPAGSTDYLPAAIAPASGITAPSAGQTLVQIGFLESLNYPFVVSNAMTTAQIFAYLPRAIGFALGTDPKTIVSNSLRPYQMSGYSATVAYIMVPTSDLPQLEARWSDASSTLYNQEDASLESLVLVIDRSIPLLIGGSTRSTASTSTTKSTGSTNTGAPNSGSLADTGSSDSSATGSAKKIAGIGLGAAVATGAYASAMFFLARRYRKRKIRNRRRSGTLSLAGHSSLSPRMPDGSINRAISISSPTNAQNTLGI